MFPQKSVQEYSLIILFVTIKYWNQSRCPPTSERLNKLHTPWNITEQEKAQTSDTCNNFDELPGNYAK